MNYKEQNKNQIKLRLSKIEPFWIIWVNIRLSHHSVLVASRLSVHSIWLSNTMRHGKHLCIYAKCSLLFVLEWIPTPTKSLVWNISNMFILKGVRVIPIYHFIFPHPPLACIRFQGLECWAMRQMESETLNIVWRKAIHSQRQPHWVVACITWYISIYHWDTEISGFICYSNLHFPKTQ